MAMRVLLTVCLLLRSVVVQGDSSCDLTSMNLVQVDNSTFSNNNCSNATHVNMSYNQIAYIGNGTFKYMWRTEVLDLSHNNLTSLENDAFFSLTKLNYLNLSYNGLTTLPLDFFEKKLSLIRVDLSYNAINNIPLPVFDKELPAISEVILHHNELTAYEPWAVAYESKTRKAIPYIDLKYNRIYEFTNKYNWIYDQRSIYDISLTDLRFNEISHMDKSFYEQYKAPERKTEVSTIMAELMMDTRNNSFNCDCFMYPLAVSVSKSYFLWTQNDLLQIRCHDPPALNGMLAFYEVKKTDFVCNVTDDVDCPAGCLCQERPHAGVIHVDCNNASLIDMPEELPSNPDYSAYEVIVNFNGIEKLDNVNYSSKITVLQAANNIISDISGEFIANMAGRENVKLYLQNNRLTRVPETIENIKYQDVQLAGNPLVCDCDMLWMKEWIKLAPKYIKKDLACSFEGETHKIVDLDEDILNCKNVGNILLIVFLSIGLAVAIALIVTAKRCPYETKVLVFKIFRIHLADNYKVDEQEDKETDAYIAFDEDDTYVRQWVKHELVKRLEDRKPQYKLFIGPRNMAPGAEAESRFDAMEKSRRLIIILSENFNNKSWCDYESCQAETLDHNDGRVIFIVYDKKGGELASQEPWLSKTKDRKVFRLFDKTEKMFWSKIRYEMPRTPVKSLKRKNLQNKPQRNPPALEMTNLDSIA